MADVLGAARCRPRTRRLPVAQRPLGAGGASVSQMVREVASKTNDLAGDGTTTATGRPRKRAEASSDSGLMNRQVVPPAIRRAIPSSALSDTGKYRSWLVASVRPIRLEFEVSSRNRRRRNATRCSEQLADGFRGFRLTELGGQKNQAGNEDAAEQCGHHPQRVRESDQVQQ